MRERRTWHVLRHRAAVGAALLGVVFGGVSCTGSSGDVHSKINSAILNLTDFPPSWRAYPQSGAIHDVLGEIAACTGHATGGKSVTTVRSSEFRNGQQHITSTGVGYGNTIAVDNRANAIGSPKAKVCATQAMRQQILEVLPGATVKDVSATVQVGGVNVPVNYAGAVSATAKVDLNGKSETVYADTIFLIGIDYYVDLNFVGVGTRVSDFIRGALAKHISVREQHDT